MWIEALGQWKNAKLAKILVIPNYIRHDIIKNRHFKISTHVQKHVVGSKGGNTVMQLAVIVEQLLPHVLLGADPRAARSNILRKKIMQGKHPMIKQECSKVENAKKIIQNSICRLYICRKKNIANLQYLESFTQSHLLCMHPAQAQKH
jgi:hypothetical protein